MHLDFEINHENMRRINTDDSLDSTSGCSFIFKNKEWKNFEKYVIFWDEKNKSTIKYLGEGCKLSCEPPDNLTEKSWVQVYANDKYVTKKIRIGTFDTPDFEGRETERPYPDDLKSTIQNIYSQLSKKIDKIESINNVIYIYADNKVIKTINLVDKKILKSIIEEEIGLNIDAELSPSSENPVQNKVITKELNKKSNLSELSNVALSGDYNDLENIPEEFTPKKHTHQVIDVVDYEESVDIDLERLLDILSEEIIRK